MYQALTNQTRVARALTYKPCGLLMGQTGAGKTTLCNKICGTQHLSGAARGSVTQVLYRNDVNCGSKPFSLIDTPGTDSSKDTYKHAVLLKEGLTATRINTIFLVLKYNNRFDKIVDNYFELVQYVFKYAEKTAVMISHMDVAENPAAEFKEICELFAEECPDVSNILFYSDKSSELDITQFMSTTMSNMNPEMLTITDEEFHLKFNIYHVRNQMKASFQEYQNATAAMIKDFGELVRSALNESVDEKNEILHMLLVDFREETEELYRDFTGKHAGGMHELDYYVFAIKMQRENVRICDEFVDKVVNLMSYNLFDNTDVRNLIKKCPNCGLVWYKTEGCDGETNCGTRVSQYYDYYAAGRNLFRYIIMRVNGKRKYQRRERQPPSVRQNRQVVPGASTFGIGCGRPMVWGALPKLADELIMELFKVKTIDEAVAVVKSEQFRQARQDYERGFSRRFYS